MKSMTFLLQETQISEIWLYFKQLKKKKKKKKDEMDNRENEIPRVHYLMLLLRTHIKFNTSYHDTHL